MAKTKKRKSRNKVKLDIQQPLTLEQLGGAEDPCFGKLYDPRAKECSRCGDCEFCAIAMGQLNHVSRKVMEKKGAFVDMEEKDIKSPLKAKEVRKLVKERIYEMAKYGGEKGASIKEISIDIFSAFAKDGWRKKRAIKFIKILAEKYGKLTLKNNRVIWNQKD